MENKKLLKFLLRDLNELDEMVAEKGNQSFDELEMEFVHTRVKGVKKLIQILHDREGKSKETVIKEEVKPVEKKVETKKEEPKQKEKVVAEIVQKKAIEKQEDVEPKIKPTKVKVDEPTKVIETQKAGEAEVVEPLAEVIVEEREAIEEEKLVELEEEKKIEANGRLGDSFSKEKSVNDLVGTSSDKLEHKISNRPVANIQSAIGINDRFQFIRELFDGNSDSFNTAVSDLDNMGNINEAVEYIQKNYKWNKNETSLKFVNLVKRRFLNE